MRKLAVVLALASTALATPALARDDSWYVGVEAGGMLIEDMDFDIGTATGAGTVDSDVGYDFDGTIGYDFGAFRTEVEVGYRSGNVGNYSSTVGTPAYRANGSSFTVPAGSFDYAGGRTSALSFMLNGMLDFGDDNSVQGFIGGGVGVARVRAENYALNTYGNFLDDSDTVFAWQAIAGLRAPLSNHVDVTLKYRFFNADDVTMSGINTASYTTRFRSHSILGGLTFNFGEPAAPPPVVDNTPPPVVETPPPVVEAAPPPPPCTPGPYIVFFEWDKSDITPEASSILDNAVSAYQYCGNAQVMLAGHADRSGSAQYNVGLSQRRDDSVQAYLVAHGIPGGVITSQAFGESRPKVETADGVRELQNRRVEITYGPGSGQ